MESTTMAIAIIGMGCRFPGGANSPDKLWELLVTGKDTWTPVPPGRWNEEAFFHPDPDMQGMYNHRGGHFLDQDIAEFDGGFFGLAPAECESMDPQQRIQLEVSYEALESAGIRLSELKGSDTGVYVATFCSDYNLIQQKDVNDITRYHTTGNGTAIVANRISYLLDLRGPSLALDTGCSGSLVAIHQACQSLKIGECRMAIAGGVNLMLSPDQMTTMSLMRCWNEDGKCYSFDDRGTGYGRGEGAAMVVLKRLDDAIRDGDPVRAIIRNSGINQDGKTNGIMVPKSEAQETLIRSVYRQAGLDPRDTTFVEAHGTGTAVGDPLEIAAIRSAFRPEKHEEPLMIGTIKPNIGHLESASGIAGLIKGVLMLEHGQLPPTIGIKSLKPNLSLKEFGIEIPERLTSWPEGRTRRVSVNSFGYGGTNAHAILDEYIRPEYSNMTNGINQNVPEQECLQILPFSGATQKSACALIHQFQQWATNNITGTIDELQDLAFTLSNRRSVMQHRVAIRVTSSKDIAHALEPDKLIPIKSAIGYRTIFVFTGQGAQWYAMGRELIQIQSSFRISLEKADEHLRTLGSGWSLLEELLKSETDSRVNESEISQPATTALQIALVDLLNELGVKPDVVVGHSSGEIAAAYTSGALDQNAALEIAYFRGKLSRSPGMGRGAMLAVGLGEKAAMRYLPMARRGKAVIACSNSPKSSTISGDEDAIVDIEKALKNDGVFARRLKVDQAYHSHHMLNLADQYNQDLINVAYQETVGSVVFVSSVTGQEKSFNFDPDYWAMNLVSPVQFSDAMRRALRIGFEEGQKSPQHIVVEIGPHNALSGPIRQICSNVSQVSLYSALRRGNDAIQTFADLAISLFERGSTIDITLFNSLLWPHRIPRVLTGLPTYPWNHSVNYWHESRLSKDHRFRKYPYHDLVGIQSPTVNKNTPVWRHFLSLSRLPWLRDHVIDGEIIFPASGFVCMAIEALRQVAESNGLLDKITRYQLKSINFVAPILIPESDKPVELQLRFTPLSGSDWVDFRIVSIPCSGPAIEHCQGMAMYKYSAHESERAWIGANPSVSTQIFNETDLNSQESINVNQFYRKLKASGNNYGPDFSTLQELRIHGAHAQSKMRIPGMTERMPYHVQRPHLIHPATLDALLHPSIALFNGSHDGTSIVTASIESLSITTSMQCIPGRDLEFSTQLCDVWAQTCLTNITVFQDSGDKRRQPALSLHGLGLRSLKVAENRSEGIHARRDMCYQLEWAPDVNFISAININPTSEETRREEHVQTKKLQMLNQASSLYIGQCLEEIQSASERGGDISDSHQRLFDWMKKFWQTGECKSLVSEIAPTDVDAFLLETATLGVEGEVLSRIGGNLTPILQQNLDPLSLITEKDLLWRLYADDASVRCYSFVSKYLQSLRFKNPNTTILEIGAGTGSATEPILEALSSESTFHFQSYDFTDLSTAFFERAQQRLHKWKDSLRFRKLDIQNDPTEQGFEEGSFDLIFASNVLHIANSIHGVLSQLRKLLKPGGRIVMIETTRNVPFYNTILGTLPGWWVGLEDGRTDGPFLSEAQWDKTLQQTGLGGIDLVVKDFEGPAHRCSLIVSKPIVPNSFSPQEAISVEILRCPSWEALHPSFESMLRITLEDKFGPIRVSNLTSAEISQERVCMVLDDGSMPILTTSNPKLFQAVTNLVSNASLLFWISAQEDASFRLNPDKNLITGFVRSVRAENPGTKIVTVDVQDALLQDQASKFFSNNIRNLITKALEAEALGHTGDMDYIYRNGQLFIPRVIPDPRSNLAVAKGMNRSQPELQNFHQPGRTLCLATDKALFLDNMEFKEGKSLQKTSVSPDLVDVQVLAWGVNFKDILIAGGHVRKKLAMAGEFSGIIVNVESDLQQRYSIGDRVCGFGATPYASQIRVHGDTIARLPEPISFNIGAAIPVAYTTAYHSLVNVARLGRGQTVLIHSAAGALGQAAVDIANWIGATIFCTVGTTAKRDFLVTKKKIVENYIFSSRTESFRDAVLASTGGKGVDVVLNTLSGQLLHASMECVAAFGTFLELGKTDAHSGTRISMAPFDSSLTVTSVDMAMIHRHKPAMAGELVSKVLSLFEGKQLEMPEAPDIFQINKIQQAFRLMQDRTHMGKIVLECGPDSKVNAPPRRFSMKYSNNFTYIVAGGLGGVGFEIAKYLVKNGARHLVLLGRRKVTTVQEIEIKSAIPTIGADIRILSCDITVLPELEKQLLEVLQDMPSVQGLLQSAMILRDRIVSEMTLEDFSTCVAPKVKGTQNLLKILSKQPLEWAVLMSSVVGGLVGTVAEANYAAGNAYLTGLARSQQDQKPRIITLTPGVIDDVGVLSSDERVKLILQRQGFPAVKVGEIIALIDHALSEASNLGKNEIISGFDYDSLRDSGNTKALDNPIFSHVLRTGSTKAGSSSDQEKPARERSIADASSVDEAENIITELLAKKIGTLIAADDETLDPTRNLAELGVDSLVVVEVKNWIGQTFGAKVQNAEISEAVNLIALAKSIASKSPLVRRSQEPEQTEKSNGVHTNGNVKLNGTNQQNGEHKSHKEDQHHDLPKQPLPDLNATLQFWAQAVRPILGDKDYVKALKLTQKFREPGGIGQRLQERLAALANDPSVENWQEELYTRHYFLRSREPLMPQWNFFATHPFEGSMHSQSQRASIICQACRMFKDRLEMGELEIDMLNERKLDTHRYEYFFNCTREPRREEDVMHKYPGNDYLVAFRRGHAFRIPLGLTFVEMRNVFQHIIDSPLETASWVGVLTTSDRDHWADGRQLLRDVSSNNAAKLQTIEAAAFVIYLDDAEPKSARERGHHFLQNGFNRWCDKTIQFPICANGWSATIGEHSMMDGYTVRRLNNFVMERIRNHTGEDTLCNGFQPELVIESFVFDTTGEIEARIETARQSLKGRTSTSELTTFELSIISEPFFRKHKVPPKSGVQLAIHLLARKFFGISPLGHETVSLGHFRKGRVDLNHTLWPSVKKFCDAASEQDFAAEKLRSMLLEAAKSHANSLMRTSNGQGIDRHLLCLEWSVQPGEEMPKLFTSDIYKASKPELLVTDCLDSGVLECGAMPAHASGLWVHFDFYEDKVRFSIWGPVGLTDQLEELMTESALQIRQILEP